MEEIKEMDLGELNSISLDIKDYKDVLLEVSNVEGYKQYLRETMAFDIKRYFLCSKEQQELIKGAYQRTKYLLDVLNKLSEERLKKVVDK